MAKSLYFAIIKHFKWIYRSLNVEKQKPYTKSASISNCNCWEEVKVEAKEKLEPEANIEKKKKTHNSNMVACRVFHLNAARFKVQPNERGCEMFAAYFCW